MEPFVAGGGGAAADFAAMICWMPGGFGAQFGLPWLGLLLFSCDSEQAADRAEAVATATAAGNRLERFGVGMFMLFVDPFVAVAWPNTLQWELG